MDLIVSGCMLFTELELSQLDLGSSFSGRKVSRMATRSGDREVELRVRYTYLGRSRDKLDLPQLHCFLDQHSFTAQLNTYTTPYESHAVGPGRYPNALVNNGLFEIHGSLIHNGLVAQLLRTSTHAYSLDPASSLFVVNQWFSYTRVWKIKGPVHHFQPSW